MHPLVRTEAAARDIHWAFVATHAEQGEAFRCLREGDAFVIPNPRDAGSATVLAALGFEALATTSGGFVFTLGRLDGATDLPVSADLENGYGSSPEAAATAIVRAAEAGAVGGSIEDYDPGDGIYALDHAAEWPPVALESLLGPQRATILRMLDEPRPAGQLAEAMIATPARPPTT